MTSAKPLIYKLLTLALLLFASLGASARTYIVAVGIGDYSDFPTKVKTLRLPPGDAQVMVDIFAGYTNVDYVLLKDRQATQDRIIRAMKKVFREAKADDAVIFFFSGHGYPGGFCAADGNITYKQVREAMAVSQSKNKMMFIDACRAGGVRVEANKKKATQASDAARKANVMLFLSSRNNENSIERRDMTNGLFTTYLREGMRGAADANNDRIVTAKELFNYVNSNVARASSGRQHPVMWGNFSDNMTVIRY